MLSYLNVHVKDIFEFVAVPVNYGMLSYSVCYTCYDEITVAVPVNYGMLSYSKFYKNNYTYGRSPRQLWNALLQNL